MKGRTGDRDGDDRCLSSSRENVLGEGCGRSAWRRRAHAGRITGRITGLRAAAGLYGRVNDRSAPLSPARRVVATAAAVAAARDISPSPRETLLCSVLAWRFSPRPTRPRRFPLSPLRRDARTRHVYLARDTPIRLEARFSTTPRPRDGLPLLVRDFRPLRFSLARSCGKTPTRSAPLDRHRKNEYRENGGVAGM